MVLWLVSQWEQETILDLVSHICCLLFADDTLIFCGANEDQLRNLCCLFLCFEAVLGLKIILTKSEIVLIGEVEDVDRLTSIFCCRVAGLPMNIWVFLWRRLTSLPPFGMILLRKWEGNW